jgi:hypothetical protein
VIACYGASNADAVSFLTRRQSSTGMQAFMAKTIWITDQFEGIVPGIIYQPQ